MLALGLLTLIPALRIQRELDRGRTSIEAGRDALFAGDLEGALSGFDAASSAFIRARTHVGSPFLDLARLLPIAGRTPDAIGAMATAGAEVAEAGRTITRAVSRIPGGLGALAPKDGRISLEIVEYLQPELERAAQGVTRGMRAFEAAESGWVVGPVAEAQRRFAVPLATLERALEAADGLARELPAFLGKGGIRRYFVAAQNPAELRGTGGFMGAFAILTAKGGRLAFSSFEPIELLPDAKGVKPPNPDFAARYGEFGGTGFWRNMNITPDFPSAAVAIERSFRAVSGGIELDGAIAADPRALAALLEATGPVNPPGLAELSSENVVEYVTNTAYSVIQDPEARKRVLGDAAKAAFDRFLDGASDPVVAVRSLGEAVVQGHLQFHATDRDVQEAFAGANLAGALLRPAGDFLHVSVTNAGANKVDYYVERAVTHRVELQPDGSARSSVEVAFDNRAPAEGQPAYVIGPNLGASAPGEMVAYVSAFCPARCEITAHRVRGEPAGVQAERELGHRVFSGFIRVGPGRTARLSFGLEVEDAWLGDDVAGSYRLTLQDQPSTVRPTRLTVEVVTPPGTRVSRTSVPMTIEGNRATWTASAGKLHVIEVEFERPLLSRAWKRFVRFVTKPLL